MQTKSHRLTFDKSNAVSHLIERLDLFMDDDDWRSNIRDRIKICRKDISMKADRSVTDEIKILEQEKRRAKHLIIPNHYPSSPGTKASTEQNLYDKLEKGHLDGAFLIILNHIDHIFHSKAMTEEINDRTNRKYAEEMFNRFLIMSGEKISHKHSEMTKRIQDQLNDLNDEFDAFQESATERIDNFDITIQTFESTIMKSAGISQERMKAAAYTSKIPNVKSKVNIPFLMPKKNVMKKNQSSSNLDGCIKITRQLSKNSVSSNE